MIGDNKGLNEAAGLTSNFRGVSCRFCTASYSELQTFPGNHQYPTRTDESMRSGTNCNEVSAFAELEYLDLSCLFPPDMFHDLAEGVIIKFLSVVLRHHLRCQNDVYLFNQKLSRFQFENGPISDIKFQEIVVSGKGASIYEFFHRLPELTDPSTYDEIYWNLYLKLREFDAAANTPAFSNDSLRTLNEIAASLIDEWKIVASTETITFKMHFLTHYADCIRKLGNLKRFSSLRFERVHAVFKSLCPKLRNFRNMLKSLSSRHERSS